LDSQALFHLLEGLLGLVEEVADDLLAESVLLVVVHFQDLLKGRRVDEARGFELGELRNVSMIGSGCKSRRRTFSSAVRGAGSSAGAETAVVVILTETMEGEAGLKKAGCDREEDRVLVGEENNTGGSPGRVEV
jgi:hypothetical protein